MRHEIAELSIDDDTKTIEWCVEGDCGVDGESARVLSDVKGPLQCHWEFRCEFRRIRVVQAIRRPSSS